MEISLLNYFTQNKRVLFSDFDIDIISLTDTNNFSVELFPRDVFPAKTLEIIDNTIWILNLNDSAFPTPLGLLKDKNIIIYMDNSCLLRFASQNIQDVPFFLYALNYDNLLPQFIKESEPERIKQIKILQKYTEWCQYNNIPIDINNLHHDKEGHIITDLKKFYEFENKNYNMFFPSYEEQEF